MISALIWLSLNFLTVIMLAFYSMMEMACVSFNKIRLQYYVAKGDRRAEWLNWLLHNPSRLFGTTLIGVNVATVCGSEFSREFHSAIGINPDFSPLTQVLIVVIFGELAPMFAARRYAEHVALLGVPLVYASAKLMSPILWALGAISRFVNRMIGGRETHGNIFITQEELLKILEEQDEDKGAASEDFNAVTANIFGLRTKDVRQVMEPIDSIPKIPSNAIVAQVQPILQKSDTDYVLIYHRELTNIIGILHARDLVRAPLNRRCRDYAQSPWFVTLNTNIMKILNQFRQNNEELAIIINEFGKAEGAIHCDDIVEEIFIKPSLSPQESVEEPMLVIERSFPGMMTIGEFNTQFDVVLDPRTDLTLSDLVIEHLGHHPEVGESIFIDPFELTNEESTMTEVKKVHITTRI
jgi:putative hemolysin